MLLNQNKNDAKFARPLLIGSSFFVAALLAIMPLPIWLIWLRPAWLLMTLIYWSLRAPYHIGLGVAWLLGLFADLLYGTLLGEHALAFVVIGFFIAQFHVRINRFPFRQQMLVVLALLSLHQMLLLWVQAAIDELPDLWLYWLPSITGALLWPLVYGVLETCNRK